MTSAMTIRCQACALYMLHASFRIPASGFMPGSYSETGPSDGRPVLRTREKQGDRGGERPGQLLLECGGGEQPSVYRVAHIAAFDKNLRLGGEIQPGQVVAELDTAGPVVVADRHRGIADHLLLDVAAEQEMLRDTPMPEHLL